MQLFSTPSSRPPRGLRAGRVTTPDGICLRYALARPVERPLRGTVTILTGRADYIERYYETISELLSRRYAVAIFDWRGQGLSSRPARNRLRGHIRSFSLYDEDLRTFMREIVLPDCPAPHFALAHSMGAHILLRAAWKYIWFERALMVSPMIRIARRRMPAWWWRGFAAAMTRMGLGKLFVPGQKKRPLRLEDFPGNPLTSDRERFAIQAEMLRAHPELAVAGPTIGWLRAALVSSATLWKRTEGRRPPLWPMMAVAAGEDRMVSTEAARVFCREAGAIPCIVLPGARHDILQETERYRQSLWAAFDSFISREEPARIGGEGPQGAGAAPAMQASA